MHEKLILFCNCQARNDKPAWAGAAAIVEMYHDIQLVTLTDLCGLSATDPGKLLQLIDHAGQVLLVACYPRAVSLLLHSAGIQNREKIRFFNLLEEEPASLKPVIGEFREEILTISENQVMAVDAGKPGKTEIQSDPSWPAWYPVIDPARCNQCGQCADFCLFGVYRKSAEGVEVVNPGSCKNNCPACARICPGVAIVFPKYAGGGAIGGSDSVDEKSETARLRQDTDAILGDDIYMALEQRKMKRRSIIREDSLQKANMERDQALEQTRAAGNHRGS
ncbi:MAG: 4Fe-4S binding protein [Bacteroidota bacterium]